MDGGEEAICNKHLEEGINKEIIDEDMLSIRQRERKMLENKQLVELRRIGRDIDK